ncbi:hypothetical protein AMTR_s00002p00255070 [Amborella trichopoda]|uniref:Uncharacterized protein n=1 Tax=Amborella trichopoda TaxID=13333 RepID=W1P054_AMBTC|nr:hypothetical protein AMTR_s00002p00255070 [Amborella trichopoda]
MAKGTSNEDDRKWRTVLQTKMTSSTTIATQKGETILVAFPGEELIESMMVPILALTQAGSR